LEEVLRALLELPAHGVKGHHHHPGRAAGAAGSSARAPALARARRGIAVPVRGKHPACAGPGRNPRPARCAGGAARYRP
jgi:hypothetical protein